MSNPYIVTYTGNGSQTDFQVPATYIRQAHVSVSVAGILTTDYVWHTSSIIRLDVAPGDGEEVVIIDQAPGEVLNIYSGNTGLSALSLNENFKQSVQLADFAFNAAKDIVDGNIPAGTITGDMLVDGAVTEVKTSAGVQASLAKADSAVQPNNAALTGTPTAPTPGTESSNDRVATTAFVKALAYAPLASPALTGNPTAPTQATGNDSDRVATTAYVKAQPVPPNSRVISTGRGLSGGGNLSADREFSVPTTFVDSGGNWTPTIFTHANVDAAEWRTGSWMRVGEFMVILVARINVTPDAPGAFDLSFQLPVARPSFTASAQASGVATAVYGSTAGSGIVTARVDTARVEIRCSAVNTDPKTWHVVSMYTLD